MSSPLWKRTTKTVAQGAVWVSELNTPEQFLLSALRLRGKARRDNSLCCCRSLLRNGFHAAGLLATEFEHFDRIVGYIDASTSDAGWIAPLSEPLVYRSEARYLRALMLCQRNLIHDCARVLGVWIPPSTVRVVMDEMAAFAKACANVGLVLPDRRGADTEDVASTVVSLRASRVRPFSAHRLPAYLH